MYQSTPLDQFLFQEKESPDDIYLRQPINGEWITWTEINSHLARLEFEARFPNLDVDLRPHEAVLRRGPCMVYLAILRDDLGGGAIDGDRQLKKRISNFLNAPQEEFF